MLANFYLGVSSALLSFMMQTILGGLFLLLVAWTMILPMPQWFPTSPKRVETESIVASLSDLKNTDSTTRFEQDFGAYASPFLATHLTMYTVDMDQFSVE